MTTAIGELHADGGPVMADDLAVIFLLNSYLQLHVAKDAAAGLDQAAEISRSRP